MSKMNNIGKHELTVKVIWVAIMLTSFAIGIAFLIYHLLVHGVNPIIVTLDALLCLIGALFFVNEVVSLTIYIIAYLFAKEGKE